MTPNVLLAGTAGYGRTHLDQLLAWHAEGLIRLAALVDVNVTAETRQLAQPAAPLWAGSIEQALDQRAIDLAVVATPPHTHFPLARTVLDHGIALYLEKPPFPLLQQLDSLKPVRRAEVGFQLARASIEAFDAVLASGAIGDVTRITAHGSLARPDSYYARNAWAGSWFADGQAVLDGPLFNPLAHVVHTALTLAGRVAPGWTPDRVEAELCSVHDIAGDDTSVLRIRSTSGPVVVAVGTSAADVVGEPSVTVHGSRGRVTIRQRDAAGFVETDGVRSELPALAPPSPPLLEALRDLDGAPDPLISFAAVRPFVTVVNAAVQAAGVPARIPGQRSVVRSGDETQRSFPGVSALIDRVVSTGSLFSELGVVWAGQTGSIGLRGYDGLSHPELSPGWVVDREAR